MASKTWTASAAGSFATAGNYDDNAAPATGDTVRFNSISVKDVNAGLSATGIAGITLDVTGGYTGKIGTEATGTTVAAYLTLGATGSQKLFVGRRDGGTGGSGPSLLLVNLASADGSAAYVYSTGSSTNNYPACCLKGAALSLYVYGGEVGFCVRPGETGTLDALVMGTSPDASAGSTPTVRVGKSASLPATVRVEAGTLYNRSTDSVTTVTVSGSSAKYVVESEATGAHTTIDIADGATVVYNGTGTITNVIVRSGCTLDMSQDGQAKVISGQITAYEGAIILLDNGVPNSITDTGGSDPVVIECLGDPRKIQISKPIGSDVLLN